MVSISVIWLNYNSMKFKDVMLQSLDSFMNLDFDGYELIIVDNASSDGSYELIRKYIEERRPGHLKVRIIRSESNLGYAGGMNLGWDARDPETRYVAFVNNDLIAELESLRELIESMEGDEKIGAVNGLIYYGDGKTIYSAGGYLNETWIGSPICNGALPGNCPGIDKEHHVTYADGAYMVVRIDAVKNTMPHGKPFINETFLYLDDSLLGLALWNKGYRAKYMPAKTGKHYVGMTTRGLTSLYYGYRGTMALSMILRTRYSPLRFTITLRRTIYWLYLSITRNESSKTYHLAIKEGQKLGKLLESMLGKLDLYKAPHVKSSIIELAGLFIKGPITFNDLTPPHDS
ncbi:glycosyltransferase [Caldivirga maquilingensis]|uniref:Glycosyl transferase family 2 n=1 Tax=Caldivirga maquilingensis (strain ATCC 700844 / DSM 13496 / JCM 10307 / IC-167) TaxID=397948 RepID=A8M972_CALMQ|nr:glycosyltransferase family 2 protein [Caldivirga maquilingensis]ABW02291.1 glycosyl transferase family 2 [Caldivirga maquilingensis IC-167]